MHDNTSATPFETKVVLSLAGIFCFRMLGLFMLLPVLAADTQQILGITPTLLGIALGIYGLTQAIFQIPLAMWSDRIGRRKIILGGLLLFIIGSVVAALSQHIWGLILGRALQGAGAIGSTVIALVADLTRPQHRTKAMAIIGMSIGLSFGLAIILAPFLNAWMGLSGIFWFTALLGTLGLLIMQFLIPSAQPVRPTQEVQSLLTLFKSLFTHTELLRLDLGIFILHAILTASFLMIPRLLSQIQGLSDHQLGWFYGIVILVAFILVMPCIRLAEKHHFKRYFLAAIFALALSLILLSQFHHQLWQIGLLLSLFFIAFTFLEAALPSLVSKIAPPDQKGSAIGIYSTAQFLGIFVGGSLGGWMMAHYHATGLYIFTILLTIIWLILAFFMRSHHSTEIS
ncbi:MAG: MFS transporter [Gammaproteobacteria bacterium]